jgi:hypothetical protein
MTIGKFAGPIFTIILFVDWLFFMFLEWLMPRENIDYVDVDWSEDKFMEVSLHFPSPSSLYEAHECLCAVGSVGY